MYYHLNIEEQIQNIMNIVSDFDRPSTTTGELCDIIDDAIYKRILAGPDGYFFKKLRAFTFTMNADGIAFSKSSKITMWPVLLPINELPLNKRFAIDNVILAALSVGEEKPNIDLFFNPVVIQLKRLELGVNITIENVIRDTKFFGIACICDKPAEDLF